MLKSRIESHFRKYVKETLSPTRNDIQFVSKVYESFTNVLGVKKCVQIGSFPRYTAIRPLHDLDILYRIGDWTEEHTHPEKILKDLADKFKQEYKNPTQYRITLKVQSHSIAFSFLNSKNEEVFAVDIVPAINRGQNEYGESTFWVPEIIKTRSRAKRDEIYAKKKFSQQSINWIKTDPLGYIKQASEINSNNSDFRKSVKFLKGWKNFCKSENDDFKLKSFHLEQLITEQLKLNPDQPIFDSLFECLTNLKESIQSSQIKDRADSNKFIDQYVSDLTEKEKNLIFQAVDAILISFEEFDGDVGKVIESGFYKRKHSEKFLFDHKIPILTDESVEFIVDGFIKKAQGYSEFKQRLSKTRGLVEKRNSIRFFVDKGHSLSYNYAWKIKNDNKCKEPRGDLHLNSVSTRNESTAYYGNHYTECFAIQNGECIARDRADVRIFEKKKWNY